jgi:FAD synthase
LTFPPIFVNLMAGNFQPDVPFLGPAYVVIGSNFHRGFGRDTGAEAFRLLGKGKGVEIEIIPPVPEGGLPVSSSRIRSALRAGNREETAMPIAAGQTT